MVQLYPYPTISEKNIVVILHIFGTKGIFYYLKIQVTESDSVKI